MINLEEAQLLMETFNKLRTIAQETNSPTDIKNLDKHQTLCLEKLKYMVLMKTSKYKAFSNYDDLNQEGTEALIRAMKSYNSKKGNLFWWMHKYISTRISRAANLHSTIRYPMKIAKANAPHKETNMPTLVEEIYQPDLQLEQCQSSMALKDAFVCLSEDQQKIINLAFGMDGERPVSINKICKQLNLTRANCIKAINNALFQMKEVIKI